MGVGIRYGGRGRFPAMLPGDGCPNVLRLLNHFLPDGRDDLRLHGCDYLLHKDLFDGGECLANDDMPRRRRRAIKHQRSEVFYSPHC
jgi:hypothetical protein